MYGLSHRLHISPKGEFVPIFRLRLHNGGSIGPQLLKHVWSRALGSERVGVARASMGSGAVSYVMTAPSTLGDVSSVETRLRLLLQKELPTFNLQLTRLA